MEALYGIGKEIHPLACTGQKGTMGKVLESRQPMAIQNLIQEPLYEEMMKGPETDREDPIPFTLYPSHYR